MKKILLLLLFALPLSGQTLFPVQVNMHLVPPYSTRLSDYANTPGKVLITLRNTQARELTVYLRASITGENGIAVFTKPDYRPQRGISLKPNMPVTLSVADLQQVFDIRQLTSRGTTFQEIERKNGLPEGVYEICVRAYDFANHTVPLSSESPFGCTSVRLNSLEPPLLVKPFESEIIEAISPQNILFSWNIPAGSTPGLRYTLRMVEVFDKRRNPNDAFLSSTSFFEKELSSNVYVYGPADPPLTPGRTYAWAVTANSGPEGSSFRNGGRSEIRAFTYEPKKENKFSPPLVVTTPNLLKLDPDLNLKHLISTVSGRLLYTYPEDYSFTKQGAGKVVSSNHYSKKSSKRPGKDADSYYYDIPAYLQPTSAAKPAKKVKVTLAMVYVHTVKKADIVSSSFLADGDWSILSGVPSSTTLNLGNSKANAGQIFRLLGSTYTNDQGEFNLAFPQADTAKWVSVSMRKNTAEFGVQHSGKMRKTCVLFIDSPYYNTPLVMMDTHPGDQIQLPDLVSLVKSHELSIVAKNSEAEGQMGGKGGVLENVNVELFRLKPAEGDLPELEGQNLPASSVEALQMGDYAKIYPINKVARVVAVGKTNSSGKLTIPRVIRFNPELNEAFVAHTYSDKNTGVYNKFDGLHVIDKLVHTGGIVIPFTKGQDYSYAPEFNTRYLYKSEEVTTTMNSRKPAVKGKVVELNMGLADVQVILKEKVKGTKEVELAFLGIKKEVQTLDFIAVAHQKTKADGYFEFQNLKPGDYIIEFSKLGYKPLIYDGNIVYPTASTGKMPYVYSADKGFSLKSGQLLQTNDIAMRTGGSVLACVSDEDGKAVVADVQIGGGAYYKTVESGLLKGCYNFPAPSGQKRLVRVKPRASEMFFDGEFTVDVLENELTKVPANTWVVLRRKHRLQVEVVAKSGARTKPVENAEVRIKTFSAKTNEKGIALLEFESPGTSFVVEVKPPGNYSHWQNEVSIPVSKSPKIVKVEVLPARSVLVAVQDRLKKPVTGAKVYVKQLSKGWGNATENYSECITGKEGTCVLQGIPTTETKVEVYATRANYIGDKKEVLWQPGVLETKITLNLRSSAGFRLNEIWGLPVQIETAEAQGQGYVVSGSFTKLPGNANFSSDDLRLDFKNLKLVPAENQGDNTHVPAQKEVELEQKSFKVKVGKNLQGTAYLPYLVPTLKFPKFKVKPDQDGKGLLRAGVKLELSSFEGAYQLSGKISLAELDGASELALFGAGELKERKLKVLLAPASAGKGSGGFRVHQFPAEADPSLSYLFKDSVRISTILHTDIKDMIPADLAIRAGFITVLPDKILPFTGGENLDFNLEKWKVVGQKNGNSPVWKYDLNNGGLTVEKAVVNTGVVAVNIKDMIIKPDRLIADKLDMGNSSGFSLGGIVPLEMLSGSQAMFAYDPNCYHDNKPHWKVSLLGKNGGIAARVRNLDGMRKNDVLEFASMNLFSDNQQQLNGPAAKKMSLYNVLNFSLNTIDVGKDFFTLVGQASLDIPKLSANGGGIVGQIVYSKNSSGKVTADVKPLFFDIEGKGQVNFRTDDAAKSQTLSEGLFTSKGKLKIYDTPTNSWFTVDAFLKHQRSGQGFVTQVDILEKQVIPLEGKGLAIKEANSGMKVEKGEWNNLVLQTVLPEKDFNNLNKSEADRTLTFIVKGGIETDPSKGKLGVTGMDSPIGSLSLYYNFPRQEVRGDFTFIPPVPVNMGVVNVTSMGGGVVIGSNGLYVRATATGDIALAGLPLPLKGSSNVVFGYYTKSLYEEDLKLLSDFGVNKSVPLELQSGIKGFYSSTALSTGKSLDAMLDEFGVKLGFKASVGLGFECRTFVNYTGGNSFFIGTGVYGYGELNMSGTATVAGVGGSGNLKLSTQVALEASGSPQVGLSTKNFVNTLKSMTLKGCASVTGHLDLQGCTPLGCVSILEVDKSVSLKFEISSKPDFSLSLDPCGNFGMPIKVLTTP